MTRAIGLSGKQVRSYLAGLPDCDSAHAQAISYAV
jgi:hypothetical protein